MHTHWDREWYLPFESMRVHLLYVVKQIIKQIESGDLPQFYLDGQAIIFDDISAVAPKLMPKITNLMNAGKLAAGPWYVLADQMLVCGESLIANLQYGIKTLKKYAQPSLIGYCPDTFGHTQDLPRILKGFGIDNAVLWRGVPELAPGPLFLWQSPDGSVVTVYHLTKGYGQMSLHEYSPDHNSAALSNLANELAKQLDVKANTDELLYPSGFDHTMPPNKLQKIIDELNDYYRKQKEDIEIVIVNLAEFLEKTINKAAKDNNLQKIKSELRDNTAALLYERAFVLNGVLSARLYLKRENREAERKLFRFCLPLLSMLYANQISDYPKDELDYTTKLLLENHPHDSICGCSVDPVHTEMSGRTLRLHQILNALEDKARHDIAGASYRDPASKTNQMIIFNMGNGNYSGPIDIEWVEELDSQRVWVGNNIQIKKIIEKEELFSGWGQIPYYKKVKLIQGWIYAKDIPALGCKSYDWPINTGENDNGHRAKVDDKVLSNGLLSVQIDKDNYLKVNANNKEFVLKHIVRDIGDGGDTYNFDPIENDSYIQAKLNSIEPFENGPLIASLVLKYQIDIPEKAVFVDQSAIKSIDSYRTLARSKSKVQHEISIKLTLKKDIPILFFDAEWENKSCDHRLEILFDTNEIISTTQSENHFSLIEREHKNSDMQLPVGKGQEQSPNRFACQRFVTANKQIFFNTGLPEYGVEGSNITITALRAVSWLSKADMRSRGGGAGPHIQTPSANCLGKNKISYGWAAIDSEMEAYSLVEQYEQLFWLAFGHKEKNKLKALTFVEKNNPAIKTIAMYVNKDENKLIMRFLNVSDSKQSCQLRFNLPYKHIDLCRLDESIVTPANDKDGIALVDFTTNELKTIAFTLA